MSEVTNFALQGLVDPSLIPSMILNNHRRKDRHKRRGINAFIDYGAAALQKAQPYDDAAWRTMIESGITSVLLTCTLDVFFCGYSKAALSAWTNDENCYLKKTLLYIEAITGGLAHLATHLVYYQMCPEIMPTDLVNDNLNALLRDSHHVWNALWEIRSPFLDSQPRGILKDTHPDLGCPAVVQFSLETFASALLVFVQRQAIDLAPLGLSSRLPHVLLTTWIHQDTKINRPGALIAAVKAVDHESARFGLQASSWSDFYESFLVNPGSRRELRQNILRGFKVSGACNTPKTIYSLLRLTFELQSHGGNLDVKNVISRKTMFASIAAWRTHMCTALTTQAHWGVQEDEMLTALCWQLNYLVRCFAPHTESPNRFPERHVIGVISFIGRFIIPIIAKNMGEAFGDVDSLISICCNLLHYHRIQRPQSPDNELLALRREMCKTWTAVLRTLDDPSHACPLSVPARHAWFLLGEPLETTKYMPDKNVPFEEGPLPPGMCSYDGCRCHFFRPRHPMHVCKGCHMVAYCNIICQKWDWDKRHRLLCRDRHHTD